MTHEVEAIAEGTGWPRSPFQRLLPLAVVGVIGLFFVINFASSLVSGAARTH